MLNVSQYSSVYNNSQDKIDITRLCMHLKRCFLVSNLNLRREMELASGDCHALCAVSGNFFE